MYKNVNVKCEFVLKAAFYCIIFFADIRRNKHYSKDKSDKYVSMFVWFRAIGRVSRDNGN